MRPDHVKAANRRLLSTEEVAEALCVTTKTVRRWIARGELPAVKLHRQWRVRVADLEAVLIDDTDAA
jgi:excisionase family DNA binding protein